MYDLKFSIIVPIYKVEKYINKCVESLIKQTYSNIEIILVDDGSPDKCPEICDAYANLDNRIRVIHKKNGGLSDARNYGIEAANGDYILFVDSDDYVELDTCERLYKFALKRVDIIIGDTVVEGGIRDYSHITCSEILLGIEYLVEANKQGKAPMAAWLNVYNREFLIENELRFKKGILHEDEEFTPRAFLKAKSIVLSNVYFYHYIIRGDSITTQKDKRKNANDLFSTCCDLEKMYNSLDNKELKKYMLDSLACKYLSLFQEGKLYQYGNEYLHRRFIFKNSIRFKTRMKGALYCISPKIYYHINRISKRFI